MQEDTHSTVETITREDFERARGHYLYIAHRLQASVALLKSGRASGTETEVVLPREQVREVVQLLEDLEARLRALFVKKDISEGLRAYNALKREAHTAEEDA